MEKTYVEFDNILSEIECQQHIDFVNTLLSTPDGMYNRVFAHTNENLSELVWQRLLAKGYSISDDYISHTWYYTIYTHGEQLAPHVDGHKHEGNCRSIKTILIYLNMHPSFEGGATCILEHDAYIVPFTGKALLMSQDVLHKGCTVKNGTKYLLRGDIMSRTNTTK